MKTKDTVLKMFCRTERHKRAESGEKGHIPYHLFFGVSLVVVLLCAGICVASATTTHYVSPSGSDSKDGLSLASAWATIQHAADTMVAGDTCKVHSGTYNEKVTISRSGTADKPIIFQGEGMPTITHANGPVSIKNSYIALTGFNINAQGGYAGVNVVGYSGAEGINISNNYIWTESGYGISLSEESGDNSLISNNEIHTGHQTGIMLWCAGPKENIDILYNTIYADENLQHRDWSDASGIQTYYGNVHNLNVSYNKVFTAGYTSIKIGGSGHQINYNEVGPTGFAHNAIEITQGDTEMIGNRVYDTDSNWPVHANAFYSAGVAREHRKNLTLKDNIAENSYGRALTIGGLEHHFIVENFQAINHNGRGIQLGDVEEDPYPWPVRITGNGIFSNIYLDISSAGEYPVEIISLGEATSNDHTDWNAYIPADVTFINPTITGSYTLPTWDLTTYVGYSSNHHFEGTVHVINSNKDDAILTKVSEGTHNGAIIFYYYADVKVVDENGNPISGANMSFTANDPTIKAKNTNYTYVLFPDGVTQDIEYTYTGDNGHTPLPSDASSVVAIADFKKDISNTYNFEWTITAEKDGYSNSTTVNPDSSWYRSDPNTYQNTVMIVLPTTIETGSISGTVTNSSNGAPIKDAKVEAGTRYDNTDEYGEYTISNVPEGTYSVTASVEGYENASESATVIADQTTRVNFALTFVGDTTPPTTTYTITPTPNEAGWNNVTPVVVTAFRSDSGGSGISYTNYSKTSETGPWTTVDTATATGPDAENVTAISESGFNVTVSDEGTTQIWYYSVDSDSNVEHVKDVTVKIDTTATGIISGIVTNTTGALIQGATVTVEGTVKSAETDANGVYTLTDVPINTYTVTCTAPDYKDSYQSNIEVSEGVTTTVDFILALSGTTATGIISGIVTNTTGATVQGATVTVEGTVKSAETDANGVYTLTDVPINTYTVTCTAPDYKDSYKSNIEVSEGVTTTVIFALISSTITPLGDLAGEWRFEEGAGGVAVDSSGNENNGIIHSGSWTEEGQVGTALEFDGVDDYVSIPNSPTLNPADEITISAWVNPGVIPQDGWNKIIAKPYTSSSYPWQQYALTLRDNQFVFELNTEGTKDVIASTETVEPNTWYHVTGTYDGSEMRIYVNAALKGTMPKSGEIASYPTDVHIGAGIYSDAETEYINGTIDEVKIYNRALSAEEIRADYEAVSPVGLWHFDKGTGGVAVDSSGNENNGIIHGSANWAAGKLDSALEFDGVDDYVSIPNSPTLNPANEITLLAWVNPGVIPQDGYRKIIAKPYTNSSYPWQQYALTLHDNQFVFELNTEGTKDAIASTETLEPNTWYHVTGTYDGSEMRIYVNAALNGTIPKSGAIAAYPTDVHIGAGIYSDAETEYITGTIDEVKIYNCALSAEEIQADYEEGLNGAANTLSGTITSLNSTGLVDATVTLATMEGDVINSTLTDSTGHYEFADVAPGDYNITATKPRFWYNFSVITVNASVPATADLLLYMKGDFNINGDQADAGDLVMMEDAKEAGTSDVTYDLNNNGVQADEDDLTLLKKVSVGEAVLE